MFHRVTFMILVAAAVFFAAPRGMSQLPCVGDDGLNVPGACCVPTPPILPPFPPIQMASQGCCFLNCNVEQVWNCTILVSAPAQVADDLYAANLSVTWGAATIPPTLLVMQYQRTWLEFPALGTVPRQVWRFLVNCDANYTAFAAASLPCPVPPCATAGVPQHFIGHIDYALNCGTGIWQQLVSLTHACGTYMHAPFAVNPVAGAAAHTDRTYSFAGPAPFAFGPTAPIAGPIIAESTRSHLFGPFLPLFWASMSETPIFGGAINPLFQSCLCTNTAATPIPLPQWTHYNMNFASGCAGFVQNFTPIPLPGLFPTGISSMSIGTCLAPPGSYAGGKQVHFWLGVANEIDPCPSPIVSAGPLHVVTGVSTAGGNVGTTFPNAAGIPITTNKWVDLENVQVFNPAGLSFNIGIGGIFLSPRIWNLNTP